MIVEFLGAGSCLPDYEATDTASLLIDKHIMVDTGWNPVRNLLRAGVEPGQVMHLFFTHMHQDHYLGLAQFLFYRITKYQRVDDLTICGPEGLEEVVRRTLLYAGFDEIVVGGERRPVADEKPQVVELPSEGEYQIDGMSIRYMESHHTTPSRCYRFTDAEGKAVVYTGDTAPLEQLPAFASGCDILIHESAFAERSSKEWNLYCHSSAMDAAEAALRAQAGGLYLVHMSAKDREAAREAAKAIFENVHCPKECDQILL